MAVSKAPMIYSVRGRSLLRISILFHQFLSPLLRSRITLGFEWWRKWGKHMFCPCTKLLILGFSNWPCQCGWRWSIPHDQGQIGNDGWWFDNGRERSEAKSEVRAAVLDCHDRTLPWLMGTAINPPLCAAYLSQMNHALHRMVINVNVLHQYFMDMSVCALGITNGREILMTSTIEFTGRQ